MTNIPLWIIPLFPLLGTIIRGAIAVSSSGNKKGAPEGIIGQLPCCSLRSRLPA